MTTDTKNEPIRETINIIDVLAEAFEKEVGRPMTADEIQTYRDRNRYFRTYDMKLLLKYPDFYGLEKRGDR